MRIIVERLTHDLFPETPAFQLAGEEGRQRLLSALDQPRWPQYRTAQEKAAVLHHGLNKNHPYVDGNKRLAVTAMEWFLRTNHIVLLASNEELVDFALRVARSELSREGSVRWVKARAVRLSWTAGQHLRWYRSLTAVEREAVRASVERGDPDIFVTATADTLRRVASAVQSVLRDGGLP